MVDEVTAVTGWSRDNARRRLQGAARPASGISAEPLTEVLLRRPEGPAVVAFAKLRIRKYVNVRGPLPTLRPSPDAAVGVDTRARTMGRYLRPARETDSLLGLSATRPSPLLRTSITVRKVGDEVETVETEPSRTASPTMPATAHSTSRPRSQSPSPTPPQ